MKVAAIDLGTNSFLCLVCEIESDEQRESRGGLKVITDICRVVRLGEKVSKNGFFLPEALARAEVALREFKQLIKTHQVDRVIATATSAARDAKNGQELIDLGAKYAIPITVIDGDLEAKLSFEGALSGLGPEINKQSILVVDVGGGSTELIYSEAPSANTPRGEIAKSQSFNVGCVRLTEMFLKKDPIEKKEFQTLCDYTRGIIKAVSSDTFIDCKPGRVVAVAGTPTTLACLEKKIDFDQEKVEGLNLSISDLRRLSDRLRRMTLTERKKLKGLDPLRADVIVAGAGILTSVLEVVGAHELFVSTRGLRYGAALRYEDF